MISIGITGGIGSGKSYVCQIFESMGYRVYYADERARLLMNTHPAIISGVQALFGPESYLEGALNRPFISQIVFQQPEKLQALNRLVHPETGRDYLHWAAETPEDYTRPFILKEAAILYESGAYLTTDAVVSVYAPKTLRLARVQQRDQAQAEAVMNRMDKQWTELEKMRRADRIIFNDGVHAPEAQVAACIRFFADKWAGNQP
ncbi:MAG: dephospho-CoA kinase [Bacteroidetes bacterium]|nr:MAG: dephospho-CoA kinase [Bacteroidota bacterium]